MRILLTNDDGIHAQGLHCLAAWLAQHHDILVVAPDSPMSAKSHSITLHKPLRLHAVAEYGSACGAAAPMQAYACSGTPSDCVMLGVLHLWAGQPPDLLISGINDGMNVAQDLTYSGTVGGALEGAVCGIPSLAVSLHEQARMSFAEAAQLVELLSTLLFQGGVNAWQRELLAQLAAQPTPASSIEAWALQGWPVLNGGAAEHCQPPQLAAPGTLCLNVNVPQHELAAVRGVAWTRTGYREYRDVVKPTADPRGKPYYWIAGEKMTDDDRPGTDTHALAQGYVSVTPLTYDLTHAAQLPELTRWMAERKPR